MSGQKTHEEPKDRTENSHSAHGKTDSPRLSATALSFNPNALKSNPAQVNKSTPVLLTPSRPPSAPASFTPGHLTPVQQLQFLSGHQSSLIPVPTPGFGPFIPGLSVRTPSFHPPHSPSFPTVPSPPADEKPNYNLQGREIAPGLTVGYAAVSPETMQEWVKDKSHAAAITIIYGRASDNDPVLGNSNNALKHQSQPWETPLPNFLSLVVRKSNLALMYKLTEICDFIESHYYNPPSLAEQQEAARGFNEDDDDIFLGPELLGLQGKEVDDYHARHMRPAKVVMIHGGQTAECRYQPTFIGIAFLMRKWGLGVKETIDRASKFDLKWHGEKLSLSELQIEGLEVWGKIQYDIWDRDSNPKVLKPVYLEYIQKHTAAEEKPTWHDLQASG